MKLLEGMKTCFKEIAKSYELNPHGAKIIIPTFSSKIGHGSETFPEVEEYLTSPIIVWDPLLQCSNIFQNGSCCPQESHVSNASHAATSQNVLLLRLLVYFKQFA